MNLCDSVRARAAITILPVQLILSLRGGGRGGRRPLQHAERRRVHLAQRLGAEALQQLGRVEGGGAEDGVGLGGERLDLAFFEACLLYTSPSPRDS